MLLIFFGSFIILVYGVSAKGWGFIQMTALFLVVGIILGFLSGLGEKKFVNTFIVGLC